MQFLVPFSGFSLNDNMKELLPYAFENLIASLCMGIRMQLIISFKVPDMHSAASLVI